MLYKLLKVSRAQLYDDVCPMWYYHQFLAHRGAVARWWIWRGKPWLQVRRVI